MHNCFKRNLTIGLLVCGVFLAAFTVSRPVFALNACSLEVYDDDGNNNPCMIATHPYEVEQSNRGDLLKGGCYNIDSVIELAMKDGCLMESVGKNVQFIFFQYGGKKGSVIDGVPTHVTDFDFDTMSGSVELKSSAKADSNNPISGPVDFDPSDKVIALFGYRAIWDKDGSSDCWGTENCDGDANSYQEGWAMPLWNDGNYGDSFSVYQMDNFGPNVQDVTILLDPVPAENMMEIKSTLDNANDFAVKIHAESDDGIVLFRDLHFNAVKGRVFKISGSKTNVHFLRSRITIGGNSPDAEYIEAPIEISSSATVYFCQSDLDCSDVDDPNSYGLQFDYTGDKPLKGYVKFEQMPDFAKLSDFFKDTRLHKLSSSDSYPVDFGTEPFECLKKDDTCTVMIGSCGEEQQCSSIQPKIYRLKAGEEYYTKFDEMNKGSGDDGDYELKVVGDKVFAVIDLAEADNDRFIILYGQYRNVKKTSGCSDDLDLVSSDGVSFCYSCQEGFKWDSTASQCVCDGAFASWQIGEGNGVAYATCEKSVEGANIVTTAEGNKIWECVEDNRTIKKNSDGDFVCALTSCPAGSGMTIVDDACVCPNGKFSYNDKCYDSKDDPTFKCLVSGQIAKEDPAKKTITCKCQEGQEVDTAANKCVAVTCSSTDADCNWDNSGKVAAADKCGCVYPGSEPPKTCATGKHYDAATDSCIKNTTPTECTLKAVDCQEGYKPNLTTCACEVKTSDTCPEGQELKDGKCVDSDTECPDGEELDADGNCVEITTSCGDDEEWDFVEDKCVALSTADDDADSEDDGGGGCGLSSMFKKKADGTYGCSLATASASGGGMYIYLLLLGYFVTARLRKK